MERPLYQRRSTFPFAVSCEPISVVGKGKVDSLAPSLLVRFYWVDPLCDEAEESRRLLAGGEGRPWRAMTADGLATRLRLAATHPILDDIGRRTAGGNLEPEPLQFVIPKEAGNGACLESIKGSFGDFSGGHDEPHVPEK
jgi:hypothetical protein